MSELSGGNIFVYSSYVPENGLKKWELSSVGTIKREDVSFMFLANILC